MKIPLTASSFARSYSSPLIPCLPVLAQSSCLTECCSTRISDTVPKRQHCQSFHRDGPPWIPRGSYLTRKPWQGFSTLEQAYHATLSIYRIGRGLTNTLIWRRRTVFQLGFCALWIGHGSIVPQILYVINESTLKIQVSKPYQIAPSWTKYLLK